LLAVTTLVVMALVIPPARAQSGVPIVSLDGRGFGHGVGLAQWGAKYMADAGAGAGDILATFYPGTQLATIGDPEVRVAVYNTPDNRVTFSFPSGGDVRSAPDGEQAPGFPVVVPPGGSLEVAYDGATYRVSQVVTAQAASRAATWAARSDCVPLLGPCQPGRPGCGLGCPTTSPPPTAPPSTEEPPADTAPPTSDTPSTDPGGAAASAPAASSNAPVWAVPYDNGVVTVVDRDRRYRGILEATAGGGPLRVVNQLDVDTYLKGMAEVPGAWPAESVAAQAIVARTYALRAMTASGELCDYDLCQVYVGADAESPGQTAGVDNTSGWVVTYGGALASTVYSADAGGISATTLEGFGTPDGTYPYLTTVHYDTPDPLPWHLELSLADVASRVGYGGLLERVSIAEAGPSGRALQVLLDGSSGPATVDGRAFAAVLGLRSTLFTPTIGVSDVAPAAPPPPAALQVLPDDAAALQRAAATAAPVTNRATALAEHATAAAQLAAPARKRTSPVGDATRRIATWLALAALGVVTIAALAQRAPRALRAPADVNADLRAAQWRTERADAPPPPSLPRVRMTTRPRR
jgi:SpoIID/LytB domain protein